MKVLPRNFRRSCFQRNNWQVRLKNRTAFFLEHQWMPLNGLRGNCRKWVIVTKWCWYWITERSKEYCCVNFINIFEVKYKVFAMPMLMPRFANGLLTASYLFFSLSNFVEQCLNSARRVISSKMIVFLLLDFIVFVTLT